MIKREETDLTYTQAGWRSDHANEVHLEYNVLLTLEDAKKIVEFLERKKEIIAEGE